MGQDFFHAHGVDFARGVVAFFDDGLEVVAGELGCEGVCDDFSGARFLLDPGFEGQGDPHGAAADVEPHIDCVGVAGGDGYDIGFPAAVKVFAGPAVGYVKVFVHASSVMVGSDWGKLRAEIVECQPASMRP